MKLDIIRDEIVWKDILKKCDITDVYYQYEYAKSMANHFESDPVLVCFGDNYGGFIYVLLIMDISRNAAFSGNIPAKTYYDAETPYGYGGPFFWGDHIWTDEDRKLFQKQMKEECKKHKIIAQFIRFYPFTFKEDISTIITDKYGTYKSTIYMELSNSENIIRQLDSQYRRKIRKAKDCGVSIQFDKGEQLDAFLYLYYMTMDAHKADAMYYFDKSYFNCLMKEFKNNIVFFYACLDDKIVGASLFLYDDKFMHFHLGGRDINAPKIPFENMLMVEAAKWGARKGITKLHLGGGMSNEDSLFQYKKKFNRGGIIPFYIGRTIYDEIKYNELRYIRKTIDNSFDMNNSFYISYRY